MKSIAFVLGVLVVAMGLMAQPSVTVLSSERAAGIVGGACTTNTIGGAQCVSAVSTCDQLNQLNLLNWNCASGAGFCTTCEFDENVAGCQVQAGQTCRIQFGCADCGNVKIGLCPGNGPPCTSNGTDFGTSCDDGNRCAP